jgi:hypothetical protein
VTERKPANVDFDTWIDQQIREATQRGEFDDLPGKGKPIAGLDQPTDEMWWVRGWLRREGVEVAPPLPMALRKEVHDLQDRLEREPTEARVRAVVEELNGRIREANRKPAIDGPPTSVSPLDVDEVVERWRTRRAEAAAASPLADEPAASPAAAAAAAGDEQVAPRRRWFRRRNDRRTVSPSS